MIDGECLRLGNETRDIFNGNIHPFYCEYIIYCELIKTRKPQIISDNNNKGMN